MRAARRAWISYALYLLACLVFLDVVVMRRMLHLGYPSDDYDAGVHRRPYPYVMFAGQPNVAGHNELGFPGRSPRSCEAGELRVAFFGGSTGYHGAPTIAEVVEAELATRLGRPVCVVNYSVVSSNHRQHLHALLEYLPSFPVDLVIFYGGFNETIQSGNYDPRPGYPYNFFFREETSAWGKLLVRHSALAGALERRFGWFTGLGRLQEAEHPFSEEWNDRIVGKYGETLELAQRIAESLPAPACGQAAFAAFYQPYRVPPAFEAAHARLRARLAGSSHAFDLSDLYPALAPQFARDGVHVKQPAHAVIGARIAGLIGAKLWQADTGCFTAS